MTHAGVDLQEEPAEASAVPHARAAAPALQQPRMSRVLLTSGHTWRLVGSMACLLAGVAVQGAEAPAWAWRALFVASAVLSSIRTFPAAVGEFRRFRVGVDILMFVAAIGAAAVGSWWEGAFLLWLFGLGDAGEELAMGRATAAIDALADLAPDDALVLGQGGQTALVPADEVSVGALVVVGPFERLPLDGELTDTGSRGPASIDEATLTGESTPVDRAVGDAVFAGTMNGATRLVLRVTKPAGEGSIARIRRLVEEARAERSSAERLTERIERWYAPGVLLATPGVLLAAHYGFGVAWGEAFYRSMAFLTAASPCALAIGTPAAVLSALARSARMGVLIKGGRALEALANARAVAMDKTGTLTAGEPRVVGVAVADGFTEDDVLRLAGAVEAGVQHPLAEAIVAAAAARGDVPEAQDVSQEPGFGVRGVVRHGSAGSVEVVVGKARGDLGPLAEAVERGRAEGCSVAAVWIDGVPAGAISLRDEPRASARGTLDRLRGFGLAPLVMMTGDGRATAQAIAAEVGIDEVHAELTPDEKLALVRWLEEERPTVFVGDGVNDAPALAAASVGVAMAAAGADVAMETADVALMGADLHRLADAVELARATRRRTIESLVFALSVIAVVAPLGAMGFATLWVAVLLHEGSTVLVVLNGLRLLGFRPADRAG